MATRSIVLVGGTNSGKTSLYNLLTGQRAKTVNYPGSTVDFYMGKANFNTGMHIIDTPGIHSLEAKSEDEAITIKALTELDKLSSICNEKPDLILSIIDLTHMETQLVITKQLMDKGYPVVMVGTMKDIAKANKITVNTEVIQKELNCPFFSIDSIKKEGVQELKHFLDSYAFTDYSLCHESQEPIVKTFSDVETLLEKADYQIIEPKTFDLDRIMLHPFFGPLSFVGIMITFFYSIFVLAGPFMDGIDGFFAGLSSLVTETLPAGIGTQLLSEGIVIGLGAIVIFVPQIAILFFGIGILESSGYLARGAVLIDKPLSAIGLNGRCFMPLLSGFACAIPAMLATRNIQQHKTRLLCNFIIPLMQCSARLPVYGLLLTMLFGGDALKSGITFTAIYVGSLVVAAIVAVVASRAMFGTATTAFTIELPSWKMPNWKNISIDVTRQTWSFIANAGPIIMIISIILWVLSAFPNPDASFAMLIGKWIEPIFLPMGVDWRVGVAILLSFAAREVFVSALVVLFSIGNAQHSMISVLEGATFQGTSISIFTPETIAGLIFFFMIAMQCASTLAVAKTEMKQLKYPLIQLGLYIGIAYFGAVAIVQISRLII